MADYLPVLSRAVAGLQNSTVESRRAVYERARAAIARQLAAIDPPLPDEDVARERAQLEEAIRRVEAEAAGGAPAGPGLKSPERAQAGPPQQPSRSAARPPEPGDERAPPPGRSGPSAARPSDARPPEPPKERPAKRADGRPIINAAGDKPGAAKSRRPVPLIALGALAAVALAIGLFLARDRIAGGSDEQQQATETVEPSGTPPQAASETAGEKADDRLAQDDPAAAPPAGQPAPAEQEVARGPDPAAPAPEAPPPPAIAPVAQRAVLYEEGPNQQSGEALNGTIIWRTESVNGGQSQPLETAIRGDVDIPGRNIKATLTIRRNADPTLPASHTIEIQFTLPENFPNAGVSNVPGVLMKADESARGAAVAGLSVRVTNGFFLIGLSNLETERSVNEQLLRDRGWIDIPILYDNGRRAVLTLEKGTPGSQAFQDAFSAWRSASAGAPGDATAR